MEAFVQKMSWYAVGSRYSQSFKGNPGIFEEPFQKRQTFQTENTLGPQATGFFLIWMKN